MNEARGYRVPGGVNHKLGMYSNEHLDKHQQHDAWYAQHPRHQGVGGVDAEREVEKAADEVENKEQHQPESIFSSSLKRSFIGSRIIFSSRYNSSTQTTMVMMVPMAAFMPSLSQKIRFEVPHRVVVFRLEALIS